MFSNHVISSFHNPHLNPEMVEMEEFHKPIIDFNKYIFEKGAEWNYVVGVPLNFAMDFTKSVSPNVALGITLGWNYLDGLYALGMGILQLCDKDNYRQAQTKAKGVLNIISGIQLFVFSYNPALTAALGLTGGAALAGPSFALAMACDLIAACIDFCNALKENDILGWMEERTKEYEYNRKRIETLKQEKGDSENKKLNEKLNALKEKNLSLKKDIDVRSKVYCESAIYSNLAKQDKINKLQNIFAASGYQEYNFNFAMLTKEDVETDSQIQNQLKKTLNSNTATMIFKVASFIGMTLLAISAFVACPYLLPIGLAIVGLVAAAYLIRNSHEIISTVKNHFGFFSQNNQAKEKSPSNENEEIVSPGPL